MGTPFISFVCQVVLLQMPFGHGEVLTPLVFACMCKCVVCDHPDSGVLHVCLRGVLGVLRV